MIEHTEDLMEVGSLAQGDLAEAKIAKRLRSRVNSMISGVDSLVARLETERRRIKEEVYADSGTLQMEQEQTESTKAYVVSCYGVLGESTDGDIIQ